MQQLLQRHLDGLTATISHSSRADGDLSPSTVEPEMLASRRSQAVGHRWHAARQVHSDRVIVVNSGTGETGETGETGITGSRPVADALVTSQSGQVLAVHAGDCAPVGFIHPRGTVGAAHAGWVGLEAGVLEATVRRMHAQHPASQEQIVAAIGPHIRAENYEFGAEHLARLAARFGDHVVSVTSHGTPAFDLTAALLTELQRLEVDVAVLSNECTAAASDSYWSHRARQEPGRLALVAWLEEHD